MLDILNIPSSITLESTASKMRQTYTFITIALTNILLYTSVMASNIFGGVGVETLNLQAKDNRTKSYMSENQIDSKFPNQYTANLGYLLDAGDFRVRFSGKFYLNSPKLVIKYDTHDLTVLVENIYSLGGDLSFRLQRYFSVFFGFEYQLSEISIKYEYYDKTTPTNLYKGRGQTIYAKGGIEFQFNRWQNYEFFIKVPIDSYQRVIKEDDITQTYAFEYGNSFGIAVYLY